LEYSVFGVRCSEYRLLITDYRLPALRSTLSLSQSPLLTFSPSPFLFLSLPQLNILPCILSTDKNLLPDRQPGMSFHVPGFILFYSKMDLMIDTSLMQHVSCGEHLDQAGRFPRSSRGETIYN